MFIYPSSSFGDACTMRRLHPVPRRRLCTAAAAKRQADRSTGAMRIGAGKRHGPRNPHSEVRWFVSRALTNYSCTLTASDLHRLPKVAAPPSPEVAGSRKTGLGWGCQESHIPPIIMQQIIKICELLRPIALQDMGYLG